MNKLDQRSLRKQVAPFEKSNFKASLFQLFNTLIPYLGLWVLAYYSLNISYVLTFVFGVIAAGFLVRMFIIFHDCCHHSFFKNRKANKIIGTIFGILTLFPYSKWGHDHSVHHATSSNLDKRGTGDIWVMTVAEYMEASTWKRLCYRIYRNPFVMFILGPIFVFLIENRFNRRKARKNERLNTYITNVGIVGLATILCWTIGWQSFLIVQGTIFMVSGIAGVWLFYVQHTFEDSYFEEDENWEYVKAAVEGSSFYKLPKPLQWLTGNIGYHHVHHLSPRVPNYKLEEVHNQTAPLQHVPTITLKTSLKSLKFRLWDEDEKVFVGYGKIKEMVADQKNVKEIPSLEK
ncbi:fatty acid desaturase [Bacillus sp. HNG]|uniref:fatty acid desaturase n=1 Tax=Bacillaceae TaxID=186817 RepID=UPI000E2E71CC|nr:MULTISPECIES: fatty acid desaturase [Bacillaceae]MDR4886169.1 fatty acid desaturase [Fredinandcohnia sp. QZ13]RFB18811.1 fatty acid desaturase [Bacillus sp. HNG]